MENIILQKVAELARNIVKKSMEGEIFDIDLLTSNVLEDCCRLSIEIVEVIVDKMNLQLRNEKAFRKEKGLVIKMKDRPRTIYTKLGQLNIKRDYYQEKDSGNFVYPIDQAIGIEKYERVSGMTRAELVTAATMYSYCKSSDIVSRGALSKQTVRNAVLSVKNLNCHSSSCEKKRKVQELHVYADEDHVHMQKSDKQKGKECQYVPLVTVTEGIEQVGRNRRKTLHPRRFVDEGFSAKRIWDEVEGYITSEYDTETLEKIYIHGDGGNWIRNGLERFPNVVHVMDEFHFEKALKTMSRKYPNSNLRARIHEAIDKNNMAGVHEIIKGLQLKNGDIKELEALRIFQHYVFNNWDAIVARRARDIPGSCTEGQVSHILSERFSRNPMGWSKEGLGKLSCARVHVFNGEKITRENIGKKYKKKESYAEYMQKVLEACMTGPFDWSIFEKETPIFNGNSGTMRLLQSYGIR